MVPVCPAHYFLPGVFWIGVRSLYFPLNTERQGLMRLRAPTRLDWDNDPLPADFVLIADDTYNHEMFEVRDASNHEALHLIAEGWVPVQDRAKMTDAELQTLARLEQMRTDDWGSHAALLHWLKIPNSSIGGARPFDRLAQDADAIIASFAADIAEPLNG